MYLLVSRDVQIKMLLAPYVERYRRLHLALLHLAAPRYDRLRDGDKTGGRSRDAGDDGDILAGARTATGEIARTRCVKLTVNLMAR